MPHTHDILPGGAYAVVSCHVERLLDDEVWRRFASFQKRPPGGFRVAALIRPPDLGAGEDERLWLARAREAAQHGPVGLHTHWTAPDHARPTTGNPGALVREQTLWLRLASGLDVAIFCGGGWYMDATVADVLAELEYADCTATSFRPAYLAPSAPRLAVAEPMYVDAPNGGRFLELPTTHTVGMLARAVTRPLRESYIHVYFHDFDLLDRQRRGALRVGLTILGRRRARTDLAALQRGLCPEKTMSFANIRG